MISQRKANKSAEFRRQETGLRETGRSQQNKKHSNTGIITGLLSTETKVELATDRRNTGTIYTTKGNERKGNYYNIKQAT